MYLDDSQAKSIGYAVLKALRTSSRKMIDGDAASSTAIESRFFCSKLRPSSSVPTRESLRGDSSS
jgi:hypothetical protein